MIKKNWIKIVISSVLIVSPLFFGLLVWNRLPEKVAIHWNIYGEADNFSGKGFAVFFMPLLLLALHVLCLFVTSKDPKIKDQSGKAVGIIYWIVPFVSIFCNSMLYAAALGVNIDILKLVAVFLGIGFAITGNYLPKVKQNYVLGIKIPWTLNSEENWYKTHRFGGKLWVASGIIMLFCVFLPPKIIATVMLVLLIICCTLPFIYSYLLYKKQK